jgi:AcrR family transcriptional regulator
MATRSRDVHLGGARLGRLRHVCGLFDGPADAARVLDPFVAEGLARGERVIHIVHDPRAYLRRIATQADVSLAVDTGQLDVRSWADAYLAGGTFRATRMLAQVRHLMREGPALGFAGTRLIGDMEWAREDLPGVEELIAYEAGLDAILARPRVAVLCAYDVRRHSPARIEAVRAVHEAASVGGELQSAATDHPSTPRERILAAASVLFAENGVAQTGVDTLIEAANVAKATFYRHFPSKEALIVAWLRDPRTRWFDRVRARAEAEASTPRELIGSFFEGVADWLEADDFIGCPYLNTSVEISDPAHPAAMAVREHLAEIGAYLEERVAAAGHADPAGLARELHALLAGAIALGVANRTRSYAIAARDAAMELLDADGPAAEVPSPSDG